MCHSRGLPPVPYHLLAIPPRSFCSSFRCPSLRFDASPLCPSIVFHGLPLFSFPSHRRGEVAPRLAHPMVRPDTQCMADGTFPLLLHAYCRLVAILTCSTGWNSLLRCTWIQCVRTEDSGSIVIAYVSALPPLPYSILLDQPSWITALTTSNGHCTTTAEPVRGHPHWPYGHIFGFALAFPCHLRLYRLLDRSNLMCALIVGTVTLALVSCSAISILSASSLAFSFLSGPSTLHQPSFSLFLIYRLQSPPDLLSLWPFPLPASSLPRIPKVS